MFLVPPPPDGVVPVHTQIAVAKITHSTTYWELPPTTTTTKGGGHYRWGVEGQKWIRTECLGELHSFLQQPPSCCLAIPQWMALVRRWSLTKKLQKRNPFVKSTPSISGRWTYTYLPRHPTGSSAAVACGATRSTGNELPFTSCRYRGVLSASTMAIQSAWSKILKRLE